MLRRPANAAILYRGNFSDHTMPGVIEGSSHDFLADAFREQTGADVGTIRGFRYGTHIAKGTSGWRISTTTSRSAPTSPRAR